MRYLVIFAVLLLSGCAEQPVCYQKVKARYPYPEFEVSMVPGKKCEFIIRNKNNDILFVEALHDIGKRYTIRQPFVVFEGKH